MRESYEAACKVSGAKTKPSRRFVKKGGRLKELKLIMVKDRYHHVKMGLKKCVSMVLHDYLNLKR